VREVFERMVYKLVTYVVTGTEGLKKRYAEVYAISESKIKVMPNWISLTRFAPDGGALHLKIALGVPSNARVVLFAHRLSKRKGAQYIPAVAEALRNENAVIVVAGEGPEKESIKLKVKSLKLDERVRFVGAIPNHEMPLYYSMADVFIMPSDEEGFPRVILEAMAMGTPFGAFDVGGIREFIPKELQRYIVPHGDSEKFVSIVRELLAITTETLKELQKIEHDAVKQFETKKVVKRFYEMIVLQETRKEI
jgi:glycosyltransferase involved in cell wall biosynthesis